MLFGNERTHKISLPSKADDGSKPNIGYLVDYLCKDVMEDNRKELFVMENSVCVLRLHCCQTLTRCRRPGILVLINDADWELEGEDKYELKTGDNIVFVSTLHGG